MDWRAVIIGIIGVFTGFGLCQLSHCGQPDPVAYDSSSTFRLVYDSGLHTIPVPIDTPKASVLRIPYPLYTDTGHVFYPIDTQAVITAYYTARYYERTFADSNVSGIIRDSVFNNAITWTSIDYRLLRPTEIHTTVKTPVPASKTGYYPGIGTHAGAGSYGIGPELLIVGKSKQAYRVGYHFGSSGSIHAGIYFKLR